MTNDCIRLVHACASCGNFIETDEIKIRTEEGWLPYHRICAPNQEAIYKPGLFNICSAGNYKWKVK